MSTKINVLDIFREHFSTLYSAKSNTLSFSDIFTFYLIPAAPVIFSALNGFYFQKNFISAIIIASSIFSGLLLNLLALVIEQKNKNYEKMKKGEENSLDFANAKHKIIKETFYNIAYGSIISVILVCFSVFSIIFYVDSSGCDYLDLKKILSGIIIYLSVNLILTVLMILKRFHLLVDSD